MKKIGIIWVGAFGFAILHHLSKHNPNQTFYAFEKDAFVFNHLKNTRQSPYFFEWVTLWENVDFLDDLENIGEFDVLLLVIPAQFIGGFIAQYAQSFQSGVTLVNLSKGIDIAHMQTPSDTIKKELWTRTYNYAVLSGWMIAEELVVSKPLWAQIACENTFLAQELKNLFETKHLTISLSSDVKNTELFGCVKNIFALYLWYLEWVGYGMSSIGYYFCELYKELPFLLKELWWEENIDFSSFALWWDLIATCFGNSRNRYFWKLVGEWKSVLEVESQLKQEKKHAEGYYTLKAISQIIVENRQLKNFQKVVEIFAK